MSRLRLMLAAFIAVALIPGWAMAQEGGTVTGTVVDAETLEPLADVQVVVEGTNRGSLTNADGVYTIGQIPPGTYTVRGTRIGFNGDEETVTVVAGETVTADLALETSAVSLDAVVVTATGEQQERELANAVSNINADQIVESAPISNVSELLTGRAAGVSVSGSSGTTGTGSRIRIRGSNSVSLSNEPIIFVDGIRVGSGSTDLTIGTGGQDVSPLNQLNPENIESIEVIKGPSAATLYGTDAANGVIRITTKRGGAGEGARWNVWVEQGMLEDYVDYPSNFRGVTEVVTEEGEVVLDNCFVFQTVGEGACVQSELLSPNPLLDPATRPYDTGYRQEYGLSVAGGSEGLTYYLSGEFAGETGVLSLPEGERQALREEGGGEIPGNQLRPNQLDEVSLRANVGARPAENLDVAISTGYISSNLLLPTNDNSVLGLVGNAILGDPFAEEGDFGGGFGFGPTELFSIRGEQEVERFTGSVNANWQPLDYLTGRATVGLDISNRFETRLFPVGGIGFGTLIEGARAANRVQDANYTADAGLTAQFDLTPSINSRTSVGVQYFRELVRGTTTFGEVLVPGTNSVGAAATTEAGEFSAESVTLGTYIEQQFGWNNRLFVTGAVRADDNSAFGQDFDIIIYPKVGVSYVAIDQQSAPLFNAVNSLRLRAAYGASGLSPDATDAVRFFNAVTATVAGSDVPAVSFTGLGSGFAGLGNPDLKPERSREFEIGSDFGMFDGRLSLELTYYNKETEDALVERRLAPSLGVTLDRFENLGSVRNQGIEAAVNATLLNTRTAQWDLGLTAATNDNELLELGENVEPIIFGSQRHQEGFPLGAFFDVPLNFDDADNNGVITPDEINIGVELADGTFDQDSAVFLGSPFSTKQAAITSSLTLFDRVQVSGLLDYRGGYKLENFTEYFRCQFAICEGLNNPDASLFEQARALNVATGLGGGRTTAPFVEDASFVKLRELALTFFAPDTWARRIGAERLNVAFTGRNLATWTDYSGLDPELNFAGSGSNFTQSEFLTQPPVRSFTVRFNVTF